MLDPVHPSAGEYSISSDKQRLDVAFIHRYLCEESYWAKGRTREQVEKSIANSLLCFGLFAPDGSQAGFARVVTDGCTFAWLCDVFVAEAHRGRGLGKRLVQAAVAHPEMQGIKRIVLGTRDAHQLYRQYGGFENLAFPERWMERVQG